MKALTGEQRKVKELDILQAATRVLASRGPDAFTMEEVAREARLAKGTLFLYYKQKDDLLLAVLSAMAMNLGNNLRAVVTAGHKPELTLEKTIRALLEHFDKKRDITGYGAMPLAGDKKEKLRGLFAANMAAIVTALENCAAGGLLRLDDPFFAGSALFGLCRGSNLYARSAGRKLPVEERVRRIMRIFLDGTRKER